MKVLFDCAALTCPANSKRGIGRYTRSHLAALLSRTAEIEFALAYDPELPHEVLSEYSGNSKVTLVSYPEVPSCNFEIFHEPDPMTVMRGRRSLFDMVKTGKSSVVFYDLIPLVFSTDHFDKYPPDLARDYLGRLELVREHGDVIFAISENTKKDLVRIAGVDESRVKNILAGSNLVAPEARGHVREKIGEYFLVVGGLDNHKGFADTYRGFFELRRLGRQVKLVVVGSENDPFKAAYQSLAQEHGLADSLIFTGFIDDESLASLYCDALALIFPSHYEGFGFPVLEAMMLGCPVITRRNSSIQEVGGSAVLYLEEREMVELMLELVESRDLGVRLSTQGLQRSKNFCWQSVADKTLDSWHNLL